MKKFFNRLFDKIAVENLTAYLVIMTAAVSLVSLQTSLDLGNISRATLLSGQWWNIFFYPFRVHGSGLLMLLLFLYIFWIFGSMLEMSVGRIKYNQFIFAGIFFMLAGTLLLPVQIDASFLYLSIFLGVAIMHPDHQIYLFFILPVKIKWLGILTAGFLGVTSVLSVLNTGNFWYVAGPLIGLGNLFLFFHGELKQHLRGHSSGSGLRKFEFQSKARNQDQPIHRCTICGRTEQDDPHLEFRYCNECDDHEYCMDHLYNHEHIKT